MFAPCSGIRASLPPPEPARVIEAPDGDAAAAERRGVSAARRVVHMSRSLSPFIAILVAAVPRPGMGQADSVARDVVSLVFAWPVGMEASVIAHNFRLREGEASVDSTEVRVGYRMLVEPHAAGRLITFHDFRVLERREPSALGDVIQRIALQVGALMPAYVVSEEGEFIRVHDAEAILTAMRAMLRPLLDSIGELNPQARQLTEAVTSEQYVTARAAEDWNALVGTWTGADFEVGAVYETEADEPSPLFPEVLIPFTYQFAANERLPCVETQAEETCVALEMLSFADADTMKTLLTRLIDRLAPEERAERFIYEALDIENTISLVAEPATLVPYYLEVTQTVSGSGREGDGPSRSFRQVTVRSYEFGYRHR